MEVNIDLVKHLTSGMTKVKSVEVTYRNGGKVVGFVKSSNPSPLKVVIQKFSFAKREKPTHRIKFDHVTSLQLIFEDDTKEIFK